MLEPRWKGPFAILPTTPTAIKVDGVAAGIHHTHARPADPFSLNEDNIGQEWEVVREPSNPLKLRVRRSSKQQQSEQPCGLYVLYPWGPTPPPEFNLATYKC